MKLFNSNGFTALEAIVTILVISLLVFAGYETVSSRHKYKSSLVTSTQLQSKNTNTSNAAKVGVTLYKPINIPAEYAWTTQAITNYDTGELGKFLSKGSYYLQINYMKNFNDTENVRIYEVKNNGKFNPNTDCITATSINSDVTCQTIKSAKNIPIYYGGDEGITVAFSIVGDTLIYITYDGVPLSDAVAFVNSLQPASFASLNSSGAVNPEYTKHFPEPKGGYENPF